MSKIYLITSGEYSDYCVNHVVSDREKAYKYCAYLNDKSKHETYYVEEYDLDDIDVDDGIKYIIEYEIFYGAVGWNEFVRIIEFTGQQNNTRMIKNKVHAYVYLDKEDDKLARKIAMDMFAKRKAEDMNL